MAIHRLNHAVLYVRSAARSVAFYRDVLGFAVTAELPGGAGAFLRAPGSTNDHDLAVFGLGEGAGDSTAGRATVGLYHLAWEVETIEDLAAMAARLAELDALGGMSDHGVSKSLYAKDPDGIEFEVMWRVPREAWGEYERKAVVLPLDLQRELQRFGTAVVSGS